MRSMFDLYVSNLYNVSKNGNTYRNGNNTMNHSELAQCVASVLPSGKILESRQCSARDDSVFDGSEIAIFSFGDSDALLGPVELAGLKSSSAAHINDALMYLSNERQSGDDRTILVCPHLNVDKQELLRLEKVPFVDVSGNAWLDFPGLYLDRRGFEKEKNGTKNNVDDAAPDLRFSDSMSLVIRILLDRNEVGVREVSSIAKEQHANVSPGQVSKILGALRRAGYIDTTGGGVGLRRRRNLLDEWGSAYRKIKNRQTIRLFLREKDPFRLRNECGETIGECGALTGKAGASLVDNYAVFNTVRILSRDVDVVEERLIEIGAVPVDRGENIVISYPRYKESAFWDMRKVGAIQVVSDLQLYLDLLRDPRRGEEAAEHLYERLLRASFEDGERLGDVYV